MKTLVTIIDTLSSWTGRLAHWLATILVALISLEVILRYVFNRPTSWNFETSLMVGGVLYLLAWSYDHYCRAHIRVDVLYTRLSPRGKTAVDAIGSLIFFFPVILLFVKISFDWALESVRTGEISNMSIWYPPMWPFRFLVAIGFTLFALQGVSNFLKDMYFLIRNRPL